MKKISGVNYFRLAVLAFASMGLELLLAFAIEPVIYGSPINKWTDLQNIIHWIATCVLWGAVIWYIICSAKNKYEFDLFQKGNKMAVWQWVLVVVFVIGSLVLSYLNWNGIKIIKEFLGNGPVKFIFQYIYYFFETMLITLILVFGQNAFETWFHKRNIPYGGIIVAITWGMVHFFSKDFATGILSVIAGFAFGSVYLLTNRDVRKTYPVLWIMFVL